MDALLTAFSVLFILLVCLTDTRKLGSNTKTKWPKK